MSSRVIQARLHPSVEEEAAALQVYQAWTDRGHTSRDIVCRALLALDGYAIPEPDELVAVRHLIEQFQDTLTTAITALIDSKIEELAAMSPAQRRQQIERTVRRSTLAGSIRSAVDVAEYEGDD